MSLPLRAILAASVTTALTSAVLAAAPATHAAPHAASAPTHLTQPALAVDFDGQDATVVRGARFTVSGTATDAQGDGVPADLTLAVTDATGRVLGTQDVT